MSDIKVLEDGRYPGEPDVETLRAHLKRVSLKLTPQRIVVMHAVYAAGKHPSADRIYAMAKVDGHAGLSLTTVYNCLKNFEKAGLLRSFHRADGSLCYDVADHPHGHFHCKVCGKVYDFPFEHTVYEPLELATEGYAVDFFEIAAEGTCPHCLSRSECREA
ncbi:MAG: Fur family transcriptional regulator [Eubacteriales bacterium]|nr:Fur family transcriptional regulator [Eubacteriales bacterium]